MTHQEAIWLGTPISVTTDDLKSPYISRVGGAAVLFRELSKTATFSCPQCKKSDTASLLAQIYAPLESYDRVIYVFVCETCSSDDGSFCFVLRSQSFNPSFVTSPQVTTDVIDNDESDKLLFDENNDWGSDNDNGWGNSIDNSSDIAKEETGNCEGNDTDCEGTVYTEESALNESSQLAPMGCKVPVRGICYPCFGLDIFEEPPKRKNKETALIKDQLCEAQKKYGDDVVELTLEAGEGEGGQETQHDKCLRKYVERIESVPSQCVRWGPNLEPLRSSVAPIVVPNCPYCKNKRRYEFQLTSPLIYFLTKTTVKKSNALHFGNVLVFTCSGNCNGEAYASEYCVVEAEI